MELKLYYSLDELKDNWKTDYKKYKKTYSSCTETQYLSELNNLYSKYKNRSVYYNNILIQTATISEIDESGYPKEIDVNFNEFCFTLMNGLDFVFKRFHQSIDELEKLKSVKDYSLSLFIDDFYFHFNSKILNKHIDLEEINVFKDFITISSRVGKKDKISFHLSFDSIKYKNFEYSYNSILEYINNQIKGNTETPEPTKVETASPPAIKEKETTPEVLEDFEPQKASIKQTLIIMHKLGILDAIKDKLKETENYKQQDISKMIFQFVNGLKDCKDYKSINPYINYLYNNGSDEVKNIYHPTENENKANSILLKFGIKP